MEIISMILGWGSSACLVLGLIYIGNRSRIGFFYMIIGELGWALKGIITSQWDLLSVSAIFTILAVQNFIKWGGDLPMENNENFPMEASP